MNREDDSTGDKVVQVVPVFVEFLSAEPSYVVYEHNYHGEDVLLDDLFSLGLELKSIFA